MHHGYRPVLSAKPAIQLQCTEIIPSELLAITHGSNGSVSPGKKVFTQEKKIPKL